MEPLLIGAEVASALGANRPVVALETTIFSALGLPPPHGEECLRRVEAAIRAEGAVPALTALLDGSALVGLGPDERERVLLTRRKVAERDLPAAIARREETGATTVSSAVALAAAAGIEVLSTGGTGGVHRGASESHDVSSDLGALARHPVVTVSSGAKAFLDLPATLEALETASVPVLGFGTDEFPAFWSRSSGLPVPSRVDSAREVADAFRAARALGWRGGILVANPVPSSSEVAPGDVASAITLGLAEAGRRGVRGAAITPVVLEAIARSTGGRTVAANLALAESNAHLAARIAAALARSR